jgi:hypothetical protein
MTKTLLFAVLLTLSAAFQAEAAVKCVNASTGSDSTTYANNNGTTQCWETIGRAVWGSTTRSSPVSGQAAQAGDVILVAGGTYTYSGQCSLGGSCRWDVVYNPVNEGGSSTPITIVCTGTCVVGAQAANSPVIGANDRDYIKWYASVADGHAWQITVDGLCGGENPDEECEDTTSEEATQVNTHPDTGPVVCFGATGCFIEGFEINGGPQLNYTDNFNGVRCENAPNTTVRNSAITSFRNLNDTGNGTAVTLYGCPNALIEHNEFSDAGAGVAFKDTEYTLAQSGIVVRYNRVTDVNYCFASSTTGEDRNDVYQNLCKNAHIGIFNTGGGWQNHRYVNNTFVNMSGADGYGNMLYPSGLGSGGKVWNNIYYTGQKVIYIDGTMPADTVVDLEHNVYYGNSSSFYTGETNRNFADYLSTYSDQDQASPASITSDPLFANPGSGDYRLCTGSGTPHVSCSGASPAIGHGRDINDLDNDSSTTDAINAGAYITGSEIIGRVTPDPITFVRGDCVSGNLFGSTTQYVFSYPAALTPGNLVVLGVGTFRSISGIAGSSTTFAMHGSNVSWGGGNVSQWQAIAAGADTSVTITLGAIDTDAIVCYAEFAGAASDQGAAVANQASVSSDTTHDSGAVTPPTAQNAVVVFMFHTSGDWTYDTDFTQIDSAGSTNGFFGYRLQSSATEQRSIATSLANEYSAIVIGGFAGSQ